MMHDPNPDTEMLKARSRYIDRRINNLGVRRQVLSDEVKRLEGEILELVYEQSTILDSLGNPNGS